MREPHSAPTRLVDHFKMYWFCFVSYTLLMDDLFPLPLTTTENMEEILDDSKFTDADVKKLLKYYEEEPASASKNPFANRMQVMAYIGALEPGFGQIE